MALSHNMWGHNGMPSRPQRRSTRQGAGGNTRATTMALALLASLASPASSQRLEVSESATRGEIAGSSPPLDAAHPRILTVLTTFNKRTPYIKAYREAMAKRTDGYKPQIFVTSDEQDEDPDGVIDYKFGEPENHRLLHALSEAYVRYRGQYDWIAVGDDDTIFMYNRARAFLKDVDHTKPVAIARVDGMRTDIPWPQRDVECYTPEQKSNSSDPFASKRCCQDFTRPCDVTTISKQIGFRAYGPGGLYWPYGGSGAFISAGLMERVADGHGEDGWKSCSLEFGHGNTDCQLGMCMVGHGLSFSTYAEGFFKSHTADPSELRAFLEPNCQVLGIHLGIRHLRRQAEYTPELFGDAAAAVQRVDEEWVGEEDEYLAKQCPETWASLSLWRE